MSNLLGNDEKKFISEFQHPFKSDKVTCINFEIRKDFWSNNVQVFKSRIEFNSGKTSGMHRIDAENFIELVKKTEEFIKSL